MEWQCDHTANHSVCDETAVLICYTQRLKFVRSVYQGMAFSRAVRGPWMTAALAADEGLSGAEALTTFTFSAARLKAVP